MSKMVNGYRFTVHRSRKTVNCQLSTVNCFKGFSLIELMVVVSLFGIAASLITASYLTFERNQRVKSAAAQLKSDLRLVQNKATSGDKGPQNAICETGRDYLGGWYLRAQKGATNYTFAGVCADNPDVFNWANEVVFESRTINLPADTKIKKICHAISADVTQPVAILFRPLKTGVEFFDGDTILTASGFFNDTTGASITGKYIIPAPTGSVKIELSNSVENRSYWVKIETTGEIMEVNNIDCTAP